MIGGGGLTINWTDTDNGTDGDPYALTFTLDTGGITNAMLAGSIANNKLANSSITINGSAIPIEYNPKVSSTCAKIKSTALYDNYCTIYFDGSYCLTQDPESGFKVDLGYGNQALRRSILIF
jgi:hypothetical protein